MSPQFSVVIPTYNRKGKISAALDSIYQQTWSDYEVIVVDDASQDGTVDWLKEHYPDVQVIALAQNRGAAGARNAGIQAARADWIAFLDSDDQWLPDFLAAHHQAISAATNPVLSACDCYATQQNIGQQVLKSKVWPMYSSPTHHLLMSPLIMTMSLVVARREALLQAGLLNESLKICHDRELYLRLLQHGDYVHVPQPLAMRVQEADSLTQNVRRYAQEVLLLLDLFFATPEGAAYRHLRSNAKSRWAMNIARTLLETKMDVPLWCAMMGKALYYSPQLVFKAIQRRSPRWTRLRSS